MASGRRICALIDADDPWFRPIDLLNEQLSAIAKDDYAFNRDMFIELRKPPTEIKRLRDNANPSPVANMARRTDTKTTTGSQGSTMLPAINRAIERLLPCRPVQQVLLPWVAILALESVLVTFADGP